MAPRHDVQAEPDLVREQGAFVVHRIGPETYSVVLEIEGKAVMLAADYFSGPEAVETAILWLKRHATNAKVIWRD
ncbi:MAG: hypothetical protein E6G37_03895 [Actinobacteria bacterium]|nr:MAG: hypothetical protein E6G63_02295 [Actinomycetota bacterium]TMK19067.1 MAG: hypothetical protein E6G65_10560 [Actinomycetota bacterium]TMK94274.1 MAG: hypothetical protein E6G37_03895 [Actinomycetota bacterium]TMM23169.1 MAG: hypothetical protein E6F95_06400 [Actinomycetota bacterium]